MNEPCLMDVLSTCYVVLSVYIACPRGVEVFLRYFGDIRKMSQRLDLGKWSQHVMLSISYCCQKLNKQGSNTGFINYLRR